VDVDARIAIDGHVDHPGLPAVPLRDHLCVYLQLRVVRVAAFGRSRAIGGHDLRAGHVHRLHLPTVVNALDVCPGVGPVLKGATLDG
jgi:hypothetical protein